MGASCPSPGCVKRSDTLMMRGGHSQEPPLSLPFSSSASLPKVRLEPLLFSFFCFPSFPLVSGAPLVSLSNEMFISALDLYPLLLHQDMLLTAVMSDSICCQKRSFLDIRRQMSAILLVFLFPCESANSLRFPLVFDDTRCTLSTVISRSSR